MNMMMVFCCLLAQGEFYVAVNGSDSIGTGTSVSPWATITHALDTVPDGSTILVMPGTYNGRIRLRGVFNTGVTVRSYERYAARLRHDDTVITCFDAKGIRLEGFDIAHIGPGSGPLVVQIQDDRGDPGGDDATSRITIAYNIIHDSYNNDLLKVNYGATDVEVLHNIFYNQSGSDEHIDINGALRVNVQGNIFFNDFEGSNRTNTQETSSFIVVKNSAELPQHGDHTIVGNIFLHFQGERGSNFLLLGEDGLSGYETQNVVVENNLMLGDGTDVMRSAFGVKGCRNITFRHNTISGDLPSLAYAMRLNVEEANPANANIQFYNNIWSDPTGTMGAESPDDTNDFSDTPIGETASFTLDNNLYWNGGAAIPSDPEDEVNVEDDARAILSDPELPTQAGLVLPRYANGSFRSGSPDFDAEFERLVLAYGNPSNGVVDGLAWSDQSPETDILGQNRGAGPDLGAFETTPGGGGNNSPTPEAYIAHLAAYTGTFTSTVWVRNAGPDADTLVLSPYQTDGTLSPLLSYDLAPGEMRTLTHEELGTSTSHLGISGCQTCSVTVGYRAKTGGGTAHVAQTETGSSFLVFPGEWDVVFDGLALVNASNNPATITATYLDAAGSPVGSTVTLRSDLPANAKQLVNFSSAMPTQEGPLLRITSSQRSVVLFLRGSLNGQYLFQNRPVTTIADTSCP